MLVGVLAFTGAPALAEGVHTRIGAFGPEGPGKGGFTTPTSIAVNQKTGDVYVYDTEPGGVGEGDIYQFNAEGEPENFSSTGTNIIETGIGGYFPPDSQIAVDSSNSPDTGDIYVATGEDLLIYSSTGESLGIFGESDEIVGPAEGAKEEGGTQREWTNVTVGPSGVVYVYVALQEADAGGYTTIKKYTPVNNPVKQTDYTSEVVLSGASGILGSLAADAAGDLYVASEHSGVVTKYEASQFNTVFTEQVGTPIAGPEGETLTIDPTNGDLYVDSEQHIAESTPSGTLIEEFGSSELGSESYGVAVSDASGHEGDVYAAAGDGSEVVIFSPASSPITEEYPLKVTRTGSGTGTVTSVPLGIDCGLTCEAEYLEGETVTLTEAADAGSEFVQWTGCTTVTAGKCEVAMSAAKTVEVEFNLQPLPKDKLTTTTNTGTGTGTVECKEGAGTYGACASEYTENTELTIKETANGGSELHSVSGTASASSCTSSPCTFIIKANSTLTAVFNLQVGGGTGPTGPAGPTGPTGPTGNTGPSGNTGSTGPTGKEGPKGEKGEASEGKEGKEGKAGTNGISGEKGLLGPIGPIGPVGAQGPAGAAGQVELVTCNTVQQKTKKKAKKSSMQKCTTKLVSGTVKFTATGASANAMLSRHGAVYAAGTARSTHGHMSLRLSPLRRLHPGHYTLTLTSGAGRHETIHNEPFTLR
ncbi:MAG TPA: hypothetical protein VGL54_05395 [Solirubrobacteraceae bacterium]|jgi:hypothetical protein